MGREEGRVEEGGVMRRNERRLWRWVVGNSEGMFPKKCFVDGG